MKQLGMTTHFSTTYHPKSDGQSKRLNQCLEQYLRCMCFLKPNSWAKWLPLAEWWYNTNYHTSLGMTPFQALYGYQPLGQAWDVNTKVAAVQDILQNRDQLSKLLSDQLQKAQQRMKFYSDKKRTEREFQLGDEVYLKLQPYKQTSMALRKNLKLSSRFYGPYLVIEKIGAVAYKLQLPSNSKIHPFFM